MSILNYFKRCVPSSSETGNFLPKSSTSVERSVNESIGDLVNQEPSAKRLKVQRHTYSPKKRAQIGKYTAVHGPKQASDHFSIQLGYAVPESTCRKFHDAYT